MTTDIAIILPQTADVVLAQLENGPPHSSPPFSRSPAGKPGTGSSTSLPRNPNTREAYGRAIFQFFRWCQNKGITDLNLTVPLKILFATP